jgi:hypothetical protein
MKNRSEKRDNTRVDHQSVILFENRATGNYHEGRMVNYSRSGMCFEADVAPEIGSEILIGIDKPPYGSEPDVHQATVVWRRRLGERDAFYDWGVGVKYSAKDQDATF